MGEQGLLINLFHTFWPALLEVPVPLPAAAAAIAPPPAPSTAKRGARKAADVAGAAAVPTPPAAAPGVSSFLQAFLTPLIKARRGTAVREFFSSAQFEAWRAEGAALATPAALAAAAAAGRVYGEATSRGGSWVIKYYKGAFEWACTPSIP